MCNWVFENQLIGAQCHILAANIKTQFLGTLRTAFTVTKQWHSRIGHLAPDLMMASCKQFNFHQGHLFPFLKHHQGSNNADI